MYIFIVLAVLINMTFEDLLLLLLHHHHHLQLHHVKTQTRVMVDIHQLLRKRVSMVQIHIRHLVDILSRLPLIQLLKQHPMLLLLHKLNLMLLLLHNLVHMLHHLFNHLHPLHQLLLHHKKKEASFQECLVK